MHFHSFASPMWRKHSLRVLQLLKVMVHAWLLTEFAPYAHILPNKEKIIIYLAL